MISDFDRPWHSRRGIETIDCNNGLLLARTTVERLASEISSRASLWKRDALGSRVVIGENFGWVFRLEGHPWAIFLHEEYSLAGSPAELSRRLSAPVIAYDCSDTTCSYGYVFADRGTVRESLALVDGALEFSSERRAAPDPEEAYAVATQFFQDQDAYEPGIYPGYFFGDGHSVPRLVAGEERLVGNPGFTLRDEGREITSFPKFERVDYVVLRARSERAG